MHRVRRISHEHARYHRVVLELKKLSRFSARDGVHRGEKLMWRLRFLLDVVKLYIAGTEGKFARISRVEGPIVDAVTTSSQKRGSVMLQVDSTKVLADETNIGRRGAHSMPWYSYKQLVDLEQLVTIEDIAVSNVIVLRGVALDENRVRFGPSRNCNFCTYSDSNGQNRQEESKWAQWVL